MSFNSEKYVEDHEIFRRMTSKFSQSLRLILFCDKIIVGPNVAAPWVTCCRLWLSPATIHTNYFLVNKLNLYLKVHLYDCLDYLLCLSNVIAGPL